MSRKAGIIGAAVVGLALSAQASSYSSMAVPGTHNSWNTTPSMVLTAGDVWVCTQTLSSANGEFKFAANNGWTVNWGGNFSVLHAPAWDVGSLSFGGLNVSYTDLPVGAYVFKFHEPTATFDLYPVTPAANPAAVQLIGSFNGDGATAVGAMTNVSGYVWETTLDLDTDADFLFRVSTASATNDRGALAATDVAALPYAGNPSGGSRYTLDGVLGGTFVFTYNLQSNTFTVAQTHTNTFVLASVTAAGNFVAGNPPDINLEKISASLWSSDFTVTNATSFTLKFIGRDAGGGIGRYWGVTNTATLALPAVGFMRSSATTNGITNATITAAPGSYRITFNSGSGEFSVQQRYTAASSLNYLLNPSFENTTYGVPSDWGVYHATSGEQADFGAHSGARCGVLLAKTVTNDWDLGNFDQTTATLANLTGQTFRVSAAFRTKGDWQADTVRIIVEWKRGTNLVAENATELAGLTNQWKTFALDAEVPGTGVVAHVLLKYDGDPGTGFLLVDDAEARIAASRFQDFNAWGAINQFTNLSPDWAVTSGRTVRNAGDNAPTGGVVFAKYLEGSGNNKAVEIFNGAATTNNLLTGQYYLQQYNNGTSTPAFSLALTNVLGPGESLVVSRAGTPTNAYPPAADILNSSGYHLQTNALTFNGDDVLVLRQGGTNGPIVDRFGQVGTNVAGSLWARLARDHTLHRRKTVFWGVTNALTNTFDLSQWSVYSKDEFSELGIHFFSLNDTNAPFLPSGYSLLLNTNASLMSPELDGGVGDISFYARAQGALAGSDVQLAIETSTSQTSTNWTLAETLSIPLTATNFTLLASYASQSGHDVVRIRHVGDGTTNRVRIDDVRVGPSYLVKRSETFAAWTSFLGLPIGTYSLAEWTVDNGKIGTNGLYRSICAELYPTAGAVTSPTFESGIGTVSFWLSQHPADPGEVVATVYTSTNGGALWTSNASVRLQAPTGTNILKTNATVALFIPTQSCVRISAANSPNPLLVDTIEIAVPSIARNLTFNDFELDGDYKSYTKDSWTMTEVAIVTNLVYSGYSARIKNSTIVSPYIDEIGTVSFHYLMSELSGDDGARLTVEISPNATNWTVLASGIAPAADPQMFAYYNTNASYHFVRIRQTASGKRILVDQISIGEPSSPPTASISAALSPASPTPDEGFYVTANVIPLNGADILAVTGAYRIASGAWVSNAMTEIAFGSYRSALLPPRPAGTKISYKATVWYGGPAAVPGTTSYTTNTAVSETNFIYVSAVKRGTVWINEIFYGPYEGEEGGGFWGDPYEHEYVEICAVAGTSITNWKVELLFCAAADISKNGGQAKYASYTIPAGTVITNTANGFGFYVLGDQELAASNPVNQVLTTLVPTNVMADNPDAEDHIYDRSGIIRLLDNYNNVIYSLAYGAYDSSSEHLQASQSLTSNTNSLSLSGTGSEYGDFAWNDDGALTIGAQNTGQTLVPDSGLPPMGAWHTPAAVAATALQGTFSQFHPIDAAQSDTLYIHYAYTNGAFTYANIDGRVHHHKQGAAGAWTTANKQVDFPGNYDTNGFAYLRMSIPAYTYDRLDTIEYVIEAIPNNPSLATAWLGSDGEGSSAVYESLAVATNYPFRYVFPIADPIEITKFTMALTNTVLRFETDGNDTLDPIVNFNVRYTTNLLTPSSTWGTLAIQSIARTNEQNYITAVRLTNSVKYFYAVEPLWP